MRMNRSNLNENCHQWLNTLCVDITERTTGSQGNRDATGFFKDQLDSLGWETESQEFDAVDWIDGGATLHAGNKDFEALVSPWPQGDHSIFLHYGRPALAVSSEWFIENIDNQDITHTPKDNIGIVDCNKLVELAAALSEIIKKI